MSKIAKEYYRYLAPDPRDGAWGLSVTGAGYQPVDAGADPIPKRSHPPGHFYRWDTGRVLSEYAVVYVTHGRGEFDSQSTGRVALAPGDAVLLFPGVRHRYRPHRDVGWGIYWAHFQGQVASRLEAEEVFVPARAVVRVGVDEAMLEAFRGMLDALRTDAVECGLVAAAKTLEILARLKGNVSPAATLPDLQAAVRQARLLLEENPAGSPDVEELIATSGVSRTHFFRAFRQQTGQSPYQYHLQLTLRRAGEMLRNSGLSVKQIALALGFRSPYHFSRLFKHKVGSAPRDYRAHWRSLDDPRMEDGKQPVRSRREQAAVRRLTPPTA